MKNEEKKYLTQEDLLQYLRQNLKLGIQSKPLREGDSSVFNFQIQLKLENQLVSSISFNA